MATAKPIISKIEMRATKVHSANEVLQQSEALERLCVRDNLRIN